MPIRTLCSGEEAEGLGARRRDAAFVTIVRVCRAPKTVPRFARNRTPRRFAHSVDTPEFHARAGAQVLLLTIFAVAVILGLAGCGRQSPPFQQVSIISLSDRLSVTPSGGASRLTGGSFSPHFDARRNGIRRDAILLTPPVAVRTSLQGLSGRAKLEGVATPVFNIGDGMQLDIIMIVGSVERTIYSRYFDAGRRAEDRAWILFSTTFDLPEVPDIKIELRLTPGMQGDLVADWLALSGLKVVQGTL